MNITPPPWWYSWFRLSADDYDDHMGEVHEWRDDHGADLVALLAHISDVGGAAWLLDTTTGEPEWGFSLTRIQQSITSYTFVHELGHNMGAHHHKEQLEHEGPGLFDYSAGWRWVNQWDGRYCSVMTYQSGDFFDDGENHIRVAHFSNPEIIYLSEPTGHPEDGDNARTIRETKHVIAAYRDPSFGVEGLIYDSYTGWPLAGWVEVHETGQVVYADSAGYYQVLLPPGTYTLTASYPMFYDKTYNVQVAQDEFTTRNFALDPWYPGFPIPEDDPDSLEEANT